MKPRMIILSPSFWQEHSPCQNIIKPGAFVQLIKIPNSLFAIEICSLLTTVHTDQIISPPKTSLKCLLSCINLSIIFLMSYDQLHF